MTPITRRLWERGTTLTAWAAEHGFCVGYIRQIASGHRGKWRAGKGAKIVRALLVDGLIDSEDELKRGGGK